MLISEDMIQNKIQFLDPEKAKGAAQNLVHKEIKLVHSNVNVDTNLDLLFAKDIRIDTSAYMVLHYC